MFGGISVSFLLQSSQLTMNNLHQYNTLQLYLLALVALP